MELLDDARNCYPKKRVRERVRVRLGPGSKNEHLLEFLQVKMLWRWWEVLLTAGGRGDGALGMLGK